MTDDLSTYGLGALPDVPDERDYPLSALYAAEGLTASVMCVAYSSSAMKAWQDKRDQERFSDFDEPTFFGQIGGTASGARDRDAMERVAAWRMSCR